MQGMLYVLNLLYFEGCVTMVHGYWRRSRSMLAALSEAVLPRKSQNSAYVVACSGALCPGTPRMDKFFLTIVVYPRGRYYTARARRGYCTGKWGVFVTTANIFVFIYHSRAPQCCTI